MSLGRQRTFISNIQFAAALGLTDFDAVGGLMASAAGTRNLPEGFEQYRADGVTSLPVFVGSMPEYARPDSECRSRAESESEHCSSPDAGCAADEVSNLRAGQRTATEIMITFDE